MRRLSENEHDINFGINPKPHNGTELSEILLNQLGVCYPLKQESVLPFLHFAYTSVVSECSSATQLCGKTLRTSWLLILSMSLSAIDFDNTIY